MKWLFLLPGLLIPITPGYAVDDPHELLPNTRQEQRAEAIGQQLRCPICQSESIEESNAALANDLRHIVREQVAQGQPNDAILQWMTNRYGEFIRLKPPFSATTAPLWLMPVLALIIGCLLATRLWTQPYHTPHPLTPEEQDRLKRLLTVSHASERPTIKEHTE